MSTNEKPVLQEVEHGGSDAQVDRGDAGVLLDVAAANAVRSGADLKLAKDGHVSPPSLSPALDGTLN